MSIPVTVPATADFRVVSGLAASAPVTVVAAFPPQPPVNVVATPTGRGQVTVTWQPPADTGGVPLTQYAIRIDGKRVVVPAGAGSAVVGGVTPGNRRRQGARVQPGRHVGLGARGGRRAGVPVGDRSDQGAQGHPGHRCTWPGCCRVSRRRCG